MMMAANSADEEHGLSPEASTVTILLSRSATTASGNSTQDSATAKLAVIARSPHKRSEIDDKILHNLRYFTFLDDRRSFANVDALLTRLAPVGTVYVACTETLDDARGSAGGNKKKGNRAAAEVSELMSKLVNVLESRNDVSDDADAGGCHNDVCVRRLDALSKNNAATLAKDSLRHLLGGENSDAFLAYRGDKHIHAEPLVEWCVGHFFAADRAHRDESDEARGTYRIEAGTLDSHLALDRTAAEAIHLLPPRSGSGAALITGGNGGNNSLFGVLNHCKTKMGSRTLEVWLRQPLVDLQQILRRQNAVAKLVEDSIGRDRLRDEGLATLRGLDIDKLGYRLMATGSAADEEKKNGSGPGIGNTSKALESLYKLHLFADKCLPPLLDALQGMLGEDDEQEGEDCALRTAFNGLCQSELHLTQAKNLAENVIDFDAAPRDFIVRSNLDDDLDNIKDDLDSIEVDLKAVHDAANAMWDDVSGKGNDKVKVEDVDSNSNTSCVWQFRLIDTNSEQLLRDIPGVRVHRILKNGVYFSTEDLEKLGSNKKELMSQYERKQKKVVVNAMSVASTFVPVLEGASMLLAELDVLASLAHAAAYGGGPGGYCRPEMTDGEEDGLGIELKEARHPCVELQDDMTFIANDFDLVFGSSSFLLVTGPNMGGKSTYIRSLGAIVTMSQIGSFVPCTSAKINIVHHILARVGAGDSQDRGISTFMAEMLEASSILRTASKRSLIIIDELGRGTSTFDGFGLAKAISEHIVQKIGCMTVFATHFHELTALEEQETSVTNSHVSAQSDGQNGLTFLYEVRPGPCLESFGIQVAEMANMPPSIIADAKRKAKQLENFDYRKRSKTSTSEEDDAGGGEASSERTAAAMEFLHKFRKHRVNEMDNEEKKRVLLPLLKQYGF